MSAAGLNGTEDAPPPPGDRLGLLEWRLSRLENAMSALLGRLDGIALTVKFLIPVGMTLGGGVFALIEFLTRRHP